MSNLLNHLSFHFPICSILMLCLICHVDSGSKKAQTYSSSTSNRPNGNVNRINTAGVMKTSSTNALQINNPTMRAASFMVDPLIIIALIALPTIGMLGLSSLIMPLIPIGIYLIQQFFPAAGRRRRRRSLSPIDQFESRVQALLSQFGHLLDSFE